MCHLQNFDDWPARNKLRNKSVSQSVSQSVRQKKGHCILCTPLAKNFVWPARALRARAASKTGRRSRGSHEYMNPLFCAPRQVH
jgi:hypothetical protein